MILWQFIIIWTIVRRPHCSSQRNEASDQAFFSRHSISIITTITRPTMSSKVRNGRNWQNFVNEQDGAHRNAIGNGKRIRYKERWSSTLLCRLFVLHNVTLSDSYLLWRMDEWIHILDHAWLFLTLGGTEDIDEYEKWEKVYIKSPHIALCLWPFCRCDVSD